MSTLYVLIGPAGSGKSTYAKRYLGDTEIVSTDDIRGGLWGDPSDQRLPKVVFAVAYARAETELRHGHDVVFDATNLTKKTRRKVLQNLRRVKFDKVAIYFRSHLDTCILNQDLRDRKVSVDVIRDQYNKCQPPEETEGWNYIITVEDTSDFYDYDFDELEM